MRKIKTTYTDPLDLVWLHAASQMGLQVERSSEVNASWNGEGVLTIGTPETLDADDSLAQMILHEVCHALCEGPASLGQLDWGLVGDDPAKRVHEHACLRIQAALADQYGLRQFFAATTFFRKYYDQLPADPLAPGADPAIAMAQAGWRRACDGPWAGPLREALARTATIAQVVAPLAPRGSLWRIADSPGEAR
jgi:hypothetical protein